MSDDLNQKMREIMAEEFDKENCPETAVAIRNNSISDYWFGAPFSRAIDRIAALPQPESQAMGRAELQPPIESTGHKPTERERALTALQHSLDQIERNAKTAGIALAEIQRLDDTEG